MFVLGPSDNGNPEGVGTRKVTVDSRFVGKDGNFGAKRVHATTPSATTDYKKPTQGAPNRKENPVDTATKGTQALYEHDEFTRQKKTTDLASREDLVHVYSSPENLPPEDTDAFTPDITDSNWTAKRHRSKLKGHFDDGQYEGEIS